MKKYRLDVKRKLDALDKTTRKNVIRKEFPEPDSPQNVDNTDLIEAMCRIAIPGFASHERRRNKVINRVKTLYQLTEALNYEGYDLQHSSVYLHFLSRNSKILDGKCHVLTAPVKIYKS